MSQIHLNAIKLCVLITLIFISTVVGFVFISNYTSMQKVENIQEDINSIIAEYKNNEIKDELNNKNDNIINDEENSTDNDNTPNNNGEIIESEKKEVLNKELESLKQINEDTVGWLKVNNTNIDYPVVQHTDNDYYLKKNFKKQNDNSGWIFMDYRADSINLSQNTIIFGHNMYYSGVMFGTLYKAKRSDWYTNPENQIIEFDTLYKKMKWQIFSIYTVEKTNDYLIANFSTKDRFQEFLDLITNRSKYDFNTPVSTTDKIITLTTCSDNGKNRLVIHAVLLSDN